MAGGQMNVNLLGLLLALTKHGHLFTVPFNRDLNLTNVGISVFLALNPSPMLSLALKEEYHRHRVLVTDTFD
jgi:hypothetical protein